MTILNLDNSIAIYKFPNAKDVNAHTNICIIDKKFYPLLLYSKEEVIEYMNTHNLITKTKLAIWRIYNLYNS